MQVHLLASLSRTFGTQTTNWSANRGLVSIFILHESSLFDKTSTEFRLSNEKTNVYRLQINLKNSFHNQITNYKLIEIKSPEMFGIVADWTIESNKGWNRQSKDQALFFLRFWRSCDFGWLICPSNLVGLFASSIGRNFQSFARHSKTSIIKNFVRGAIFLSCTMFSSKFICWLNLADGRSGWDVSYCLPTVFSSAHRYSNKTSLWPANRTSSIYSKRKKFVVTTESRFNDSLS